MKINDDDLRKIYCAYIQDKIPFSRGKCPSPEKLLSSFLSPGTRHKKGKIINHITSCAYCAQEFSFFLEIHRQSQTVIEEIDKILQQKDQTQTSQKNAAPVSHWPKIFRLRPSWKYVFIPLLTIVFIVLMILVTNHFIITVENEERGELPGQIQLIAPAHLKPAQAPLIFKWKGVKNSNHYILEIYNEALLSVWKSPKIFENFYQLSPAIKEKMLENKVYFWMITVFLADGTVIESSFEDFILIK